MDSLIDDVKFSSSSLDIEDILNECREDYNSKKDSFFVGISISECNEGVNIKARHSCESKDQLMIALQGAINLFFASDSEGDK